MVEQPIRLAVAGVGNNISALYQGALIYRQMAARGICEEDFPGVSRPRIGGIGVSDLQFVAAFDLDPVKISRPLGDAALNPPNNYPQLVDTDGLPTCPVDEGIHEETAVADRGRVAALLREREAEVLIYSLPTGLQWAADAYAMAAADAGVAVVNCTPEHVARSAEVASAFARAGVPVVGDDLASHLGSSVVHGTLLGLLRDRGLTLSTSYQLNFGGNADFRNLRENSESKRQSKMNALDGKTDSSGVVDVIPSAGYIAHLEDHKVAVLNIEAQGWAGTPVSVDVKLKVQDSSNAAGVIIDLIRIAAAGRRRGIVGFPAAAATLLKSPPGGRAGFTPEVVQRSFQELEPEFREAATGAAAAAESR